MNSKVEDLNEQTAVNIAEMRLLNALYVNKDNFQHVGVERDLFIHETYKDIFDSLAKLVENNIPITPQALFQDAAARNINVTFDIIKAIQGINSDKNVVIKDAIEMLADTKSSVEALKKLDQVRKLVSENPIRDEKINDKIRTLLSESESELMPIVHKQRIMTFEDVESQYMENFEDRKNGKQYQFGDPILDKVIKYGPAPGTGGLIAAATGMGKSAWCLNLINRMSVRRVPLMYYSLEMGLMDTFDRFMSMNTDIDMDTIVNPQDQETFKMLKKEIQKQFQALKENPNFRFSECASISLAQIKQDIKKFQQDIGQEYMVVVFDLLSMVKEFMITDERGMNFAQGIEVAINILNALAKELGFHYIAVLQMNRKGEGDSAHIDDLDDLKKFRPARNQIKNAGAFLERCRWAIGLFRPKYYAELYIEDKELWEDLPDYCEVSMLKQNNGSVGIVGKYLFNPDIMKMTPVEDEESEEKE